MGQKRWKRLLKLLVNTDMRKRGIPEDQAKIIVAKDNFHGRTTTIVSFSNDEDARKNFGPYTPGFEAIDYNDIAALESAISRPNVAAFLVEPIQGEAGVNTPSDDYIRNAKSMCDKHNVLFIADEIQTGIARTGALLAVCGKCDPVKVIAKDRKRPIHVLAC